MAGATSGPVMPMLDRNSTMFGVNRNGTGRLESNSPVTENKAVKINGNILSSIVSYRSNRRCQI